MKLSESLLCSPKLYVVQNLKAPYILNPGKNSLGGGIKHDLQTFRQTDRGTFPRLGTPLPPSKNYYQRIIVESMVPLIMQIRVLI